MRIIQTIDFDNKTIIHGESNIFTPDEIEVVDDVRQPDDTDTHYYETESRQVRHKATNGYWACQVVVERERGEPVSEELTNIEVSNEFVVTGNSVHDYEPITYRSTENLRDYPTAEAFNKAKEGKFIEFTTQERFSNSAPKPKILATLLKVPYPVLPFEDLGVQHSFMSFDEYDLVFDIDARDKNSSALAYDKTFHAKITLDNGEVLEGSATVKMHYHIPVGSFVPDVDKSRIRRIEYSMDTFVLEWFDGRATYTPESISREFNE